MRIEEALLHTPSRVGTAEDDRAIRTLAAEVERLREALKFCREALRDNLSKWDYKNEPIMLEAINKQTRY